MNANLKSFTKIAVAVVLLASLTIQADPFKTWDFTPPITYENLTPINAADTLSYTLYCNDTPDASGPPYNVAIALDDPGAPPSTEDMDPVVQGRAGTYVCVATAFSSLHREESVYSAKANFIVTAADLGFVPNPPTNLILQ